MEPYLEAAIRLHQYIVNTHWDGQANVGPDPTGRINWRITRFVKSYTRWFPWKDDYAYLQGQSYWIRANLILRELTGSSECLNMVGRSTDFIVQEQLANGAWEHPPIRERWGLISAVETVWASLGLVAAYQESGSPTDLDAALRGYDALLNIIGFRRLEDSLAMNYYGGSTNMVPNVTAMALRLMAEIYETTGTLQYPDHSEEMIRFLEYSQMENGELVYIYGLRPHFQCYQYNSFQFMDLAHYYRITRHERVRLILAKIAAYLATGLTERGSSRYDCFKEVPEVNYWTAALAAALREAHELGLGDYLPQSERAFCYLLTQQRPDGAFDFSARNYGLLRDRRSYPRYLAMILHGLLCRARADTPRTSPDMQRLERQPAAP